MTPTPDLTEELTVAVRQLNATLTEFRPQVDDAVKSQLRIARRAFAALFLAVLLTVGSVGCVVWQRQDVANHRRVATCEQQNTSRAVSRTAWAVAWEALDHAATPAQRVRIDAVRNAQQSAYAPLECK